VTPQTIGQPSLTFGLRLPNSGPFATAETIVEAAVEAEKLGYHYLWVHDHINWTSDRDNHFAAGSLEAWKGQDPNFFESLSTLTFLSNHTRKVRLGVSGMAITLRDPRVLARQVLTAHALSGGRLVLAVGIGGIKPDFDMMGISWNGRGERADEYLAVLDAAFSNETLSSFNGKYVQFQGAGFFPKPKGLQRWIVGGSEAALRRVARFGSGWLVAHENADDFAKHMHFLSAILAEKGRSLDSLTCGPELFIALEDTYQQAFEVAAATLEDRFGNLDDALRASLVGTPDQVVQQIQRYVDAGARHIEFKILAHTFNHYMTTARRIASEVFGKIGAPAKGNKKR